VACAGAADAGSLVGATLEHATGGVIIAFAEVLEDAEEVCDARGRRL
jgi:hypothetical protein